MECIDFFSKPPNMFIFQKKSNQNNCGGLLFLIYIIVSLLISLIYILDYALNEKYIYEAVTFYNQTNVFGERQKMIEDEQLNPYLNFNIIFNHDNFSIFDYRKINPPEPIEMNKTFERGKYIYSFRKRLEDIKIRIVYLCGEDLNCNSFKDKKNIGTIQIIYPEHQINHTDTPPVYENTSIKQGISMVQTGDKILFSSFDIEWENIRYNDQKSLFSTLTRKKTEYIFGHVKSQKITSNEYEINDPIINQYIKGFGYALNLYEIKFFNEHKTYIYYKRKIISFLSVLANIFALLSGIFSGFSSFNSFYSKNFDSYKIIENILKHPKLPNKPTELSSNVISSINDEEGQKSEPEQIENTSQNERLIDEPPPIILNKYCCGDFFINYIPSKCCQKKSIQKQLNNANYIIQKYLSVELLIYNQIMLENIFQDYRWSNRRLNHIQNNEMIMKLNNG